MKEYPIRDVFWKLGSFLGIIPEWPSKSVIQPFISPTVGPWLCRVTVAAVASTLLVEVNWLSTTSNGDSKRGSKCWWKKNGPTFHWILLWLFNDRDPFKWFTKNNLPRNNWGGFSSPTLTNHRGPCFSLLKVVLNLHLLLSWQRHPCHPGNQAENKKGAFWRDNDV